MSLKTSLVSKWLINVILIQYFFKTNYFTSISLTNPDVHNLIIVIMLKPQTLMSCSLFTVSNTCSCFYFTILFHRLPHLVPLWICDFQPELPLAPVGIPFCFDQIPLLFLPVLISHLHCSLQILSPSPSVLKRWYCFFIERNIRFGCIEQTFSLFEIYTGGKSIAI